jgi:predicted nucleic-acid-binding protein
MSAVSLDTNVLLRWLLGDVPEHTKLVEKLLAKNNTYHVADMAIQEVVYVLERLLKMDRNQVVANIRAIMAQANINCNRGLFELALDIYEKHNSLSFVDCCLASYAQIDDVAPIYTFDKAFIKKLPKLTKEIV